jgi:hypothetical protein
MVTFGRKKCGVSVQYKIVIFGTDIHPKPKFAIHLRQNSKTTAADLPIDHNAESKRTGYSFPSNNWHRDKRLLTFSNLIGEVLLLLCGRFVPQHDSTQRLFANERLT